MTAWNWLNACPTAKYDGLCDFLLCQRTETHYHGICPDCGSVRFGNMICDTCKSARERVAIEDGRAEGEVTPWGEIIRPLPPMNPYDMDPHNVANYIRQAFLEAEGKDNADAYLAGRLLSWADMLDGMPFWVSSEAWLRERTTCLRERKVV